MKIPQGIIGDNEGVYFSLQSTTNTDLYLALNSDFSVKGLVSFQCFFLDYCFTSVSMKTNITVIIVLM